MKMKVIRDSSGKVINIGDWDYMEETVEDPTTGEIHVVSHNPIPEGSTEDEEEISQSEDGGLYVM